MRRNQGKLRRGAAAVVAAVCLPALIGVMALAIDGGLLRSEGWRAQVAADAASYAAARTYDKAEKSSGGDAMAAATQAAIAYASASFPASAPPQVTVTRLTSPPTRYPSADPALRVVVSTHPPRLFSGIFGGPAPVVSAASVSVRLRPSGGGIIVLNPTADNSLSVVGSGVIGDPGKPRPEILVKSKSTTAGYFYGESHTYATSIGIVGKYGLGGSATINGKTTNPDAVRTGMDPSTITDPLAGQFNPPDVSGLPVRQFSTAWSPTSPSNPLQLAPGRYNGAIQFGGGIYYAMAPGVYHLKSGDFNPSGGAHVTAAPGVTIYLENGNFVVNGGSDFTAGSATIYLGKGDFLLSGGATTHIAAPGDGPYKDVVLVQAPTPGAPRQVVVNGGTSSNIAGTIHAPAAATTFSGGSYTINGRTQLIVDTLTVSGDARILPDTRFADAGVAFHLAQ